MTKFRIGTGGWEYFKIPGIHALLAYSKAFNFVEVNSTFYQMPKLDMVKSWRKIVPKDFEFSVRCNKKLTHELKFESIPEVFSIFDQMVTICNILDSEFLHFQTPAQFDFNQFNVEKVTNFFSSLKKTNLRYVLEIRNPDSLNSRFIKYLQDLGIIHCVDLLKKVEPSYLSDVLYTRIFGKGFHNVYQPLDNELMQIDKMASKDGIKKSLIVMHSNKMFKDAARLKIYNESGKFPSVTKSTGINSLVEVLKEDAVFPSNKFDLISDQGWKLIDFTSTQRVHASDLIEKLPEKVYYGIDDIVHSLRGNYFE
ncbi:MAG: DUF72 domain-containing protein [Candidatus Bathyarchaeota archaeon]